MDYERSQRPQIMARPKLITFSNTSHYGEIVCDVFLEHLPMVINYYFKFCFMYCLQNIPLLIIDDAEFEIFET